VSSGRRIVAVMVIVAMGCGLTIASVFEGTSARIARNREALLERSVLSVLPGAVEPREFELAVADAAPRPRVLAGYAAGGELVGLALPAAIMGYQDTIRLLFGYDPRAQQIVGLAVLESRETPGLGAKIATDPNFLAAFEALDVRLDDIGLVNAVELTPRAAARKPWQVDAISGATISSRAVVSAVNGLSGVLAEIRRQLAEQHDG
jgi:electron transport complex protein RnfG